MQTLEIVAVGARAADVISYEEAVAHTMYPTEIRGKTIDERFERVAQRSGPRPPGGGRQNAEQSGVVLTAPVPASADTV